MDFTSLVQIIVVTILYSTLIAPNIKKMSDIRGEIGDSVFPLKDKNTNDYKDALELLSVAINKKMQQYSAIYRETMKFLRLLYVAMLISVCWQSYPLVIVLINKKELSSEMMINTILMLAVFIILIVAMKIFILRPDKIRTFRWLASVGISQTYANDIFKPSIQINRVPSNLRENNNHANISLASDIALFGYNTILTIENIEGTKLYYVLAGKVHDEKHTKNGANFYSNGKNEALVDLAHSIRLKPGQYKIRLIIFEIVFSGVQSPVEVEGAFTISKEGASMSVVDIDLNKQSKNYIYKSENGKIKYIDYNVDFEKGECIRNLISISKFQKYFSNTKGLFCIYNINGLLTYDSIRTILNFKHIAVRKIKLFLSLRLPKKHRYNKIPHLDLSIK